MTQFSLIIRVRWVITYIQIEIFYARINIIPPACGGLGSVINLVLQDNATFPPACGGLGGESVSCPVGIALIKGYFSINDLEEKQILS
jgi:hypothetical protein